MHDAKDTYRTEKQNNSGFVHNSLGVAEESLLGSCVVGLSIVVEANGIK